MACKSPAKSGNWLNGGIFPASEARRSSSNEANQMKHAPETSAGGVLHGVSRSPAACGLSYVPFGHLDLRQA